MKCSASSHMARSSANPTSVLANSSCMTQQALVSIEYHGGINGVLRQDEHRVPWQGEYVLRRMEYYGEVHRGTVRTEPRCTLRARNITEYLNIDSKCDGIGVLIAANTLHNGAHINGVRHLRIVIGELSPRGQLSKRVTEEKRSARSHKDGITERNSFEMVCERTAKHWNRTEDIKNILR